MKYFVALTLLLLNFAAQAGGYYGGDSAEEIQRLNTEVDERSKSVPDDPYSLYQEREWASNLVERFAYNMSQGNPYQDEIDRFSRLKDDLASLQKTIQGLTALSDIALLKSTWRAVQRLVQRSEAAGKRSYNYTDSDEFFTLVAYYNSIARSLNLEAEETTPEMIFEALTDQKLLSMIESYLDYSLNDLTAKTDERQQVKPLIEALLKKVQEYKKSISNAIASQETKETISSNLFYLIATIGALSILSITAVRLFPEAVMTEWVASGQVIQFVTVMILLSAIMVLGLSGLLTEDTIGTLLGGIGGYVLSQGVGRSVARRIEKEQNRQQGQGGNQQ